MPDWPGWKSGTEINALRVGHIFCFFRANVNTHKKKQIRRSLGKEQNDEGEEEQI